MKKIIFFLLIIISSTSFASFALAQTTPLTRKMAAEYRDKGYEAQGRRDYDAALTFYQKALELDPGLTFIYNDLGVIYESKGWTDQAKKAYERALEFDPSLASAYYNLGSIYEKEGDMDKAIYYFKKRIEIGDSNDVWASRARKELQSLGVESSGMTADPTFMDRDLNAFEESKKDAKVRPKGNDLDPKNRKRQAKAHLVHGKQLISQGRYSEANMELAYAEMLDPKNKEIQNVLEEANRLALVKE